MLPPYQETPRVYSRSRPLQLSQAFQHRLDGDLHADDAGAVHDQHPRRRAAASSAATAMKLESVMSM